MSNDFQTAGKITHLERAARHVTEKFRVREFVIEISDGKFPQLAKMQLVQDHCDLLNDFKIGDMVKVRFNLRGRMSSQGKVFTNLQAWRIENAGMAAAPQQGALAGDFDEDTPF